MNNENLGRIANSHLAHADLSELKALDPKCLKLAQLHSDAVDYAKTEFMPFVPKNLVVK